MFYKRNDGKLMIGHRSNRVEKKKETREERAKRLEEEFWKSEKGIAKLSLMKFNKYYTVTDKVDSSNRIIKKKKGSPKKLRLKKNFRMPPSMYR